MADMTIKQLAVHLQKKIDVRMEHFMIHYNRLKAINTEIEELEKKMAHIIEELEPVESLIYNQNPELQRIFESLKRVYPKEKDGVYREAD
jgi:uncharacterized Fe-S cluster-containing protein